MTRKLLSLMLVVAIAGAPFSCATEEPVEPPEETLWTREAAVAELERAEEELGASPETRELIEMLQEGAARLAERGMTVDDLARLQAAGSKDLAATLGYSEEEAAFLRQRLEALRDGLFARFPALGALVTGAAAAEGGSGVRLLSDDEVAIPLDPPEKGVVTCKWVPFLVALLTCANASIAAMNIGVYFVCAYQALCSYCLGGWVNEACS